jgi:acetyl esterase
MDVSVNDEERHVYSAWTDIDSDLQTLDERTAQAILAARLDMAKGDRPRFEHGQPAEDVDVLSDIPYMNDGLRGHRLDIYLPHDAVMRDGHSTPVYVAVHGGGFIYGHKELTRTMLTHLAQQGFGVFSLNYRVAPQTDFMGQLADIRQALGWVAKHIGDYPVDPESMFVTGDSAGATLALYTCMIEHNPSMARLLATEPAGVRFKGATFISGLFDLQEYLGHALAAENPSEPDDGIPVLDTIAPMFFSGLAKRLEGRNQLELIMEHVDLPPIFMSTSSDDFLQSDSLKLASLLSERGHDFELRDRYAYKGQTFGHDYPMGMSWIPEGTEIINSIRDFSYDHL